MTLEEARMIVAQAWCLPTTEHIEMNAPLAEAFAEILVRHTSPVTRDALETTMFPEPGPEIRNKEDFYSGCVAYRATLRAALNTTPATNRVEHVCGASGFNGMKGDTCPACEAQSAQGNAP